MNKKIFLLFAIVLVSTTLTYASILTATDTGYNSRTYAQNYQDLLRNGQASGFNTTQTINTGTTYCNTTNACLWVPWLTSSTACGITNLHTGGIVDTSNRNMTLNLMVTDEFSEVGRILAYGNTTQEAEFDKWYNTLVVLASICNLGDSHTIPCWEYSRNGTLIDQESSNDSASDGTWRIIIALYDASANTNFSTGNRTKYFNHANTMMEDSIDNEFVYDCKATRDWGTICWWPFSGIDTATSGINSGNTADMYLGYYPELIQALQAYYKSTSNSTILTIIDDSIKTYFVATNYSNTTPTTSAGYKQTAYRWVWNTTGGITGIGMPASDSYYWTAGNPSWDTADALRVGGMCRLPVLSALISYNSTTQQALANQCTALESTSTYTATASCQQYTWDGSCSVGPSSGFKLNGMFIPFHTYKATASFTTKLDEIMSHYSWSGKTFDSTSCGNGYTYDTVRALKGLAAGLGYDEIYFGTTTPSNTTIASYNDNGSITLVSPINDTTLYTRNVTLNVTISQPLVINDSSYVTTYNNSVHYNELFTSSAGVWTGGIYNSTTKSYDLRSSYGYMTADVNLTDYQYIELNYSMYVKNGTNHKVHIWETSSSTDNDRLLGSRNGVNIEWKPEPGYSPSHSVTLGAWHNYSLRINTSNKNLTVIIDGSYRWSKILTTLDNSSGRDYLRIATGDIETGGYIQITNVSIKANKATTTFNYYPVTNTTIFSVDGSVVCTINSTEQTSNTRTCALPSQTSGTHNWSVSYTNYHGTLSLLNLYYLISINTVTVRNITDTYGDYVYSTDLWVNNINLYNSTTFPYTWDHDNTTYTIKIVKTGWYNKTTTATGNTNNSLNVTIEGMYNAAVNFTQNGTNNIIYPNCRIVRVENTTGQSYCEILPQISSTNCYSFYTDLYEQNVSVPPGISAYVCEQDTTYPAFNFTINKSSTSVYTANITVPYYEKNIQFDCLATGSITWDGGQQLFTNVTNVTVGGASVSNGLITITHNELRQLYQYYNTNFTDTTESIHCENTTTVQQIGVISSTTGEPIDLAQFQLRYLVGNNDSIIQSLYTNDLGVAYVLVTQGATYNYRIIKEGYVDGTGNVNFGYSGRSVIFSIVPNETQNNTYAVYTNITEGNNIGESIRLTARTTQTATINVTQKQYDTNNQLIASANDYETGLACYIQDTIEPTATRVVQTVTVNGVLVYNNSFNTNNTKTVFTIGEEDAWNINPFVGILIFGFFAIIVGIWFESKRPGWGLPSSIIYLTMFGFVYPFFYALGFAFASLYVYKLYRKQLTDT